MTPLCVELSSVFLAGLLAGEELVIRYGVRTAIRTLQPQPQIQLRQALIRRLRVLVPAIALPTVVTAVAATALGGNGLAFGFRCTGVLALLLFMGVTLIGTVPINKGILDWRPEALPESWEGIIRAWERLDTVRCWGALVAFASLVAALASPQA